jgi:hypothetical protein
MILVSPPPCVHLCVHTARNELIRKVTKDGREPGIQAQKGIPRVSVDTGQDGDQFPGGQGVSSSNLTSPTERGT